MFKLGPWSTTIFMQFYLIRCANQTTSGELVGDGRTRGSPMRINLKYDNGKLFWHHEDTVHHMILKELPMDTIPQVAEAMQTILSDVAENAARTNGLIRRPKRVKLTGAQFVQTLV